MAAKRGSSLDGRERVLDLVRQPPRELLPGRDTREVVDALARLAQVADHAVEGPREFADLVGVVVRHGHREVALTHAHGGVRQRQHPLRHAPRQHDGHRQRQRDDEPEVAHQHPDVDVGDVVGLLQEPGVELGDLARALQVGEHAERAGDHHLHVHRGVQHAQVANALEGAHLLGIEAPVVVGLRQHRLGHVQPQLHVGGQDAHRAHVRVALEGGRDIGVERGAVPCAEGVVQAPVLGDGVRRAVGSLAQRHDVVAV
jgi:hypothetical protein